jgi:hypothetical protein
LSRARGGGSHHVESDGIVTRSFRDAAEHWSDRHVRHRLTDGLGQLIDGMRREADYRTVADNAANVARRQIVLSDMDAVGAGKARDIGAIVDDNQSVVTVRQLDHPRRDGEKFFARNFFCADLKKAGAAAQERGRKIDGVPARAGCDVDVNYGIE